MANGDAERTIRHSLLERPPGRNPRAPATPSADRPRCPIAPCRASKGLKMLKTTRASYWLELASIWDRRHVRLGSAPPRLRRRYARNDGNARGNGNSGRTLRSSKAHEASVSFTVAISIRRTLLLFPAAVKDRFEFL